MSSTANKPHFIWTYIPFTVADTLGQIFCASSFTLVYLSHKLLVKDAGLTHIPDTNEAKVCFAVVQP